MVIEAMTVKCGRCEYEWVRRTGRPKQCPKCHSPYWDQPRVRGEGKMVVEVEVEKKSRESVVGAVASGNPCLPPMGKSEKPDMDALRGICAGNIPAIFGLGEDVALYTGVNMRPEVGYGGIARTPLPVDGKPCRSCDEPMQAVKGKWVCMANGCGDEGRSQGVAE